MLTLAITKIEKILNKVIKVISVKMINVTNLMIFHSLNCIPSICGKKFIQGAKNEHFSSSSVN